MIDYFVWIILHLGAWALMLLASAGAGLLFLRDCRFDSLLERAVFTIAAGLGCWGVLLFLLGLAGLLYTAVIIGLTVAAATATAAFATGPSVCPKCLAEIKERPLFVGTYVGCLC